MPDEPSSPPTPTSRRRSSFAGQTFADLFGTTNRSPSSSSPPSNSPFTGPITSAAAQAQRRRLSLTTVGLNACQPNSQASPFGPPPTTSGGNRTRDGSFSSGTSGTLDESAVEDSEGPPQPSAGNPPATFARRMSFGARALRDSRTGSSGGSGGVGGGGAAEGGGGGGGNINGNGRTTSFGSNSGAAGATGRASPAKSKSSRGPEGFNWSENLRNRAQRASISGGTLSGTLGGVGNSSRDHGRQQSVAVMEPPIREMPKQPKAAPDHFQERILKGDFYMD
ncbi:MAG: hypothetical protein M1820_006716 [Bogoriella megaspora]|nr:MAG: hypothetical protein M1820_006716 [Bogoriella megaspora]